MKTDPFNEAHLALKRECIEYMQALIDSGKPQGVSEMLAEASYVYLTGPARIRLAWSIIKTLFY